MIIHSTFKDYYDGSVAQFRDENLHWVRKTRNIKCDIPSEIKDVVNTLNKIELKYVDQHNTNVRSTVHTRVVGVAGKFYPYIYTRFDSAKFDYNKPDDYQYDDYDMNAIYEIVHSSRPYWKYIPSKLPPFKDRLTSLRKYRNDDVFIQARSPILHIFRDNGTMVMEANPHLNHLKFGRCMDTWEIMQEISMYYASVLTAHHDIPEPPNDVKITQHGFDLKKSFRKAKTKNA